MTKPYVEDVQLQKIVSDLYRPNRKSIGSGSTAAALRNEIETGLPTKGKCHKQKASDNINSLRDWLKNNPNAYQKDRAAAENVLLDLLDAYKGVKK